MKIAAFDLGSHMAVAHNGFGPESVRVHGEHFKGDRPTRAGLTLIWLIWFFSLAKLNFGGFDAILIERPFARGQAATRSLWGVAGLIEAVANIFGAACLDATPAEVKKFSTGRGDADKDAMTFAAQLTGYLGDDEHEGDAWCALRYAEANLQIAPEKSKKGKKNVEV